MEHVTRIDRVVAEFDVWFDDSIPFAKMKVKVLAREGGDFLAVSNLAVRNLSSRERDGIAGLGSSVQEALGDFLPRFFDLVKENTPPSGLTEADFEWSAAEDF
jgi:hypothetical protein